MHEVKENKLYRKLSLIITILALVATLGACAAPASPTAAPAKPTTAPATGAASPATAATSVPAAATKPAAAAPTSAPAATAVPAVKIKRGGTARIHRVSDWERMDPHLSQLGRSDALLVYDSLVDLQKDAKTSRFLPAPMLAASWDMTNPKSIVFKLQKGVKFHDGSDFNAQIAKWNLDRIREHPKAVSKEYTALHDNIEVVDNDTFKLNLKAPSGAALYNLTHASDDRFMMASKAYWEKEGDEGMFRKSVGTGPFTFEEWKTGDRVTYKKFPGYWMKGEDGQPLPYLDSVLVRFIQDVSVAVVEMKAGNMDYMEEIPGKDVPGMKSASGLTYKEMPWQFAIYFFGLNARSGGKLSGDKMKPARQAINYAIDKQAMASTLGLGIGKPAYYHLGPSHIGYSESVPKYDFNLDKAKQLMKEAGLEAGIDINLDIIARPEDIQNAQVYKQMLEKAGVRMTINQQDRVAWGAKMSAGTWDMMTGRSLLRVDPDQVLAFRFGSKSSGNYAGWDNPKLDECLAEGASEIDLDKRQKVYERCQAFVPEDAYYGFSWMRPLNYVHNSKLQGVADRFSGWYLTKAWLQ
jgi:peptide/nickel transport system substrate-binding protein